MLLIFLATFIRTKRRRFSHRDKLIQFQQRHFSRFSRHVLKQSRFYRPYAIDHHVTDLKRYPILDKQQHMQHFNAINTANLDVEQALSIAIRSEQNRQFEAKYLGYSVGLSSGTSGNRGLFVTSDKERAQWAAYIMAKMLPLGAYRHRIGFFLRANNNLYQTVNHALLQFHFFDLIVPMEQHLAKLNQLNPTVLIAPAQVLRLLAAQQGKALTLSPKKIISVAEVLEPQDQHYIETAFGQKVHQVYQCTEGFIACTCEYGQLHLNEDIMRIDKEWLDKSTGRFVPIITDFRRHTQPIVRYRLDDILIEDKTPCLCGSVFTRLRAIEGRCDDILYGVVLDSTTDEKRPIFPDFVRNTIIAHVAIEEYQVWQTALNELQIAISPYSAQLTEDVRHCLDQRWHQLGVKAPTYHFHRLNPTSMLQKKRRVWRDFTVND